MYVRDSTCLAPNHEFKKNEVLSKKYSVKR
jgi:hypothetical protein